MEYVVCLKVDGPITGRAYKRGMGGETTEILRNVTRD